MRTGEEDLEPGIDTSTIQWVEILARHVSIILSLAMVRKETAARTPSPGSAAMSVPWYCLIVDKKPRLLKKNINHPASNVPDLLLRRFFSCG